mgnify:CR=1 FL=1
MTKREFLRILGLATLGLTSGSLFNYGCKKRKSFQKNWVWMSSQHFTSPDEWKKMFARMKKHRIDAALVQGEIETFKKILPIGREEGIEIHSWIFTLMCDRKEIIEDHPDWYTVNRNGVSSLEKPPYVDYYKWLCPSHPEVQEYLKERVSELAELDGLKGIHLDYVRYPDVILPIGIQPKYNLVQDREYPQFDFCYCSVCRKAFKEQYGADPLELPDPPSNIAWRQFRYDSVTNLVNKLAVVAHNKSRMLTAAVFPTPDIARRLVRQDWPNWHLDSVMPMIYHKFYNKGVKWIKKATQEGVKALSPTTKLYSGLFVPALSPSDLVRAVSFASEGGAKGIVLFNAEAMTDAHWKSLGRVL